MVVPQLLKLDLRTLPRMRRAELDKFAAASQSKPELAGVVRDVFDRLLPRLPRESTVERSLEAMLAENGFDRAEHEHIRADLIDGRLGLAQNRLPASAVIQDVQPGDVIDATIPLPEEDAVRGREAIASGAAAIVTLAAGLGSRWTQGAGVVKALHPFRKWAGRHRTFLEVHLAKSRRAGRQHGVMLPHVVTTSYLTHAPIEEFLRRQNHYGYPGPLLLSPGRAIGLRLVPMERDLRFLWEEMPQQLLDEQAQKVRQSLHTALIAWAKQAGEGGDYTDNVPAQCLHPVGHWYEVSNLMRNGVLLRLLQERPNLRYLLVHNIDCLGVDLDPGLLGLHIRLGACLSFEVTTRRLEDRGGGLARVQGRPRILEGLAMPREEDEFALSYYNSLSTWIDVPQLLALFELSAKDLPNAKKVSTAIRNMAARMPTYITLKEVKKRWGHGQEDIFPVAQFEKLWGDMSALPEARCQFVVVPRLRGQQLKDPAQLDGWLRDGSAAHVESLCQWE
jgi:UDP-N-acetylglucosamine pyrophosphorylase